jgi:hypothetical protein
MPGKTNTAEKILASLKGLRDHLQQDEQPLYAIPGIWDAGQERGSAACDVVLTNQRLFGYYYVSFPRERLFLDAITLSSISRVALRQKSFEPLFRELQITAGQRKIYIRASRQKIEELHTALRSAIETYAPMASSALTSEQNEPATRPAPVYEHQEIRRPFETSLLAISILFVGGIILEIAGALLWMTTGSAPTGLPLCIAGLLAVFFAMRTRRQRDRGA